MYEILLVGSAAKTLKKLDRHILLQIVSELEHIAKAPYAGEQLHGQLHNVFSWHKAIKGTEYRIAYQIKDAEVIVLILKIGSRENFYKELWKQLR